jgi:hypothetical protein
MDVFILDENNKTAFDRYLETLTKFTVEVDEVYATNSGRLTFELDGPYGNIHECNYMKVYDDYNDFTRYAFIDTMTVVNGLVSISYIEDIWSNYAKEMHLRNSLLTRSRIIDYGEVDFIIKPNGDRGNMKIPFYTLPASYTGNNALTIKRVFDNSVVDENNVGNFCNLVVEMQWFKLTEKGEVSERQTGVFMVSVAASGEDDIYREGGTYQLDIDRMVDCLSRIIVLSSNKKIINNDSLENEFNYEISKSYLLPIEFGATRLAPDITTPFNDIFRRGKDFKLVDESATPYKGYIFNKLDKDIGYPVLQASYQIPHNFKTIGVGSVTRAINIVENGTDINVDIYTIHDDNNFGVYISLQNQFIEITEDFQYIFPIAVQSADVTQQQRTARAVENVSGALQVIGGVANIVTGAATLGTSTALLGVGQASGQLGTMRAGQNAVLGSTGDILGGAKGLVGGITNLVVANKDMYVTNRGINARSNASINARYGLVKFEIVPDNEREMRNIINETGYVCNEIVDEEILKSANTGYENEYNVLLFEYVKVYGNFAQNIASALGDILLNGFKIWYDESAIGREGLEVWEGLYE